VAHIQLEFADPESAWNRYFEARCRLATAIEGLGQAMHTLARAFRQSEIMEADENRATDEAVAYMFKDLPEVRE
jgi:hypothetical protein